MTRNVKKGSDTAPPAVRKNGEPKKPYQSPRLVSQSVMEAVAASCTPTPPGKAGGSCIIPSS
jgi:hypothetical protein